jgi:hypothetical protein
MDTISGLPAHPLLVHIPVILIPVAAVGVIIMAIKPAWHRRYRWAVLALGLAATIGTILAANAGEGLEEKLMAMGEANTWEEHAQAGETAQTVAIVFLVALLAFILVPWFLERRAAKAGAAADGTPTVKGAPKWIMPVFAVVAIGAGVGSVATVINAGHSGAKSVWEDVQGGEGG